MEAQRKQVSRSSRVTVPFYSPSTRHYGQTPAEIIREARASIMSVPTSGIKPVQTSRPFTPKEKERTLFGNIKKRLSRPPSSFSLSYLQKQDALPRIKLPAIEAASSKKSEASTSFRSVQSLDNLIEEHEWEGTEERRKRDSKGLPFFRKSHSSPQERRMLRTISMKDGFQSTGPEPKSIYTISGNFMPDASSRQAEGDQIVRPNDLTGTIQSRFNEKKRESIKTRVPRSDLTQVTGDHQICEIPDLGNESLTRDEPSEEILKGVAEAVGGIPSTGIEETEERASKLYETVGRGDAGPEEKSGKKEAAGPGVESTSVIAAENDEREVSESNNSVSLGDDSSVEKGTATGSVSEYLAVCDKTVEEATKKNLPKSKEIIELYETAQYYGVIVNECDRRDRNEKCFSFTENEAKSSGYLASMKDSIRNFDEKLKMLDSNIENFEEKLRKTSFGSLEGEKQFRTNESEKDHRTGSKSRESAQESRGSNGTGWDSFWKNSYFKQRDETVGKDEVGDKCKLNVLQGFISRLNRMNATKGARVDEISIATKEMYDTLKNMDVFSSNLIGNEIKITILRSLYNFADREDPRLLLHLARIIFALRVNNSLPAACKMVFKVAKSDGNDHLFVEIDDVLELFLEGVGLVSPMDAAESCIYGYGAIKFLTMNQKILSKLVNLGVLDLLILHLKIINLAKIEGHEINEQVQHALFQLTGAVRNIAAGDGVLPLFITTNSIPVLCKILHLFRYSEELVTNISRILSLLSAVEDATHILVATENIMTIMIELIEQYKSNDKILIRLSYCLGNIVAYNDLARVQLSRSETSVMILVRILQLYTEKDFEMTRKERIDGEVDVDSVDDIIVKIIRILANMCMNPVVGSNLSPSESNGKNSVELSRLLTLLLKRKDPGITLLACLGCLNNISYYCSSHSSLVDVTEGVIRVLGLPDEECQAEAARVLGNLTRLKEIRDLIASTGGVEQLGKLLESEDKEVYRSACGVLVNLMLDAEIRKPFVESRGVDKLVDGLDKFLGDWSLAGIVCRAIWNSCADNMNSVALNNNLEKLINILANSLDEENWKDGDASWEEFAVLATDLLEKINTHFESTQ